jgi:hypothetical protein
MNVSFTHIIFLHSLHQLVQPYTSVEQVHVFLAGTSSCPACVSTSSLLQLRYCHLQSEFYTSWRFTSLSTPPDSAPIDCTTPIHCTRTFMDVHHTSVFWTKNSITARCLKRESATDVTLKIHYISAICRNDTKLGMRAGETSDLKPSKLHFSIFVNGWEK